VAKLVILQVKKRSWRNRVSDLCSPKINAKFSVVEKKRGGGFRLLLGKEQTPRQGGVSYQCVNGRKTWPGRKKEIGGGE